MGMPWRRYWLQIKGSEMPKMKTKSGAKKRFKVTATGKVLHARAASATA